MKTLIKRYDVKKYIIAEIADSRFKPFQIENNLYIGSPCIYYDSKNNKIVIENKSDDRYAIYVKIDGVMCLLRNIDTHNEWMDTIYTSRKEEIEAMTFTDFYTFPQDVELIANDIKESHEAYILKGKERQSEADRKQAERIAEEKQRFETLEREFLKSLHTIDSKFDISGKDFCKLYEKLIGKIPLRTKGLLYHSFYYITTLSETNVMIKYRGNSFPQKFFKMVGELQAYREETEATQEDLNVVNEGKNE